MKSLSITLILLVALLINCGNEQMLVTAQCEKVLHGGGCKPDECSKGCRAMFGAAAMGLCFFFQKPNDTCLCRYHC
ncbi:hypothetical protein NC652_038297 [Populus alba x Populus x berolinensis]|uniref:Defensin-like protein n=2 Tax=Populus alba x Populus x berolinensis TaxID=444605 RepID=A0AAD6PT72_9ROSI|nr:hypothetical protein NC652_038297 [Populus alba x Populus x berolinensis]KAJ6960235.1 hypothetical protein NC653_038314 [Populus alba x Populus x berolinensis]